MKYFYVLMLIAVLFLGACSKTSTPSSVETMLRNGKWKLSSGTLTLKLPSGLDTTLNYLDTFILQPCHADDYISFYSATNGAVYSNTIKCNPSDPDSTGFGWVLGSNNTAINIYNSQYFYYSVLETILPYQIDTVSKTPVLELDSNYYAPGQNDVDSIYNLSFSRLNPASTGNGSLIDINGVSIANLTATTLTLNFAVSNPYTTFPDSLGHHQWDPIATRDTFYYSLTYTNF